MPPNRCPAPTCRHGRFGGFQAGLSAVEGPSAVSSVPEDATLAALGELLAKAAGPAAGTKLK
jgi:hypothetical protein